MVQWQFHRPLEISSDHPGLFTGTNEKRLSARRLNGQISRYLMAPESGSLEMLTGLPEDGRLIVT